MASGLSELFKSAAQELPPIESNQFGAKFDVFGNSRLVLIGDGSHGTSEFYRARAAITKRLIEEHGFTHVAVECDWPDARSIDHYVRQHSRRSKDVPIRVFDHFPRWMWRNTEVQEFIDWLRDHNARLPKHERTSFNGLDLYSMSASVRAVLEYLERVDPSLASDARKRYSCLVPWLKDPSSYGLASAHSRTAACEPGAVAMLTQLLAERLKLASHPDNGEAFLDAEMNARVVRDAERYYRAMYEAASSSWNVRDAHMFAVLSRLLKLSPGSKAVVWAHNSHLGDARASSNGQDRGELNLGQLCREAFPGQVSVIGCGTHAGTVAAAHEWDEPMRVMDVVPSRPDSYERALHDTGLPSFLVDMRRLETPPMLQRFIGVIYRPATERYSHYIETILSEQYDAFVWFDRTTAVHAFETAQPKEAISKGETYPFGV
ncbi:putative erythromycin esterase [Annulohypoxylon truncatum]|uniref:putative erythromycin esterase n=1 Tax=Annulohypoxylon truncatum TaxID=327061 RepID=UPI0020080993|nr:putative erythromycin esterase [Annulohypoxylon truncatum]KAI1206131.1 putative erythromycin esterase [Annulohypoxylon truncatum]